MNLQTMINKMLITTITFSIKIMKGVNYLVVMSVAGGFPHTGNRHVPDAFWGVIICGSVPLK